MLSVLHGLRGANTRTRSLAFFHTTNRRYLVFSRDTPARLLFLTFSLQLLLDPHQDQLGTRAKTTLDN
jgi:hypothetical protein